MRTQDALDVVARVNWWMRVAAIMVLCAAAGLWALVWAYGGL